ncbi:MAG: class I SAM-dependent methyltransferase [Bacteroidia bacterium]|nr:class I SAM-dependent methyltransferase [Bacteroidia bacterium]
MNEIIEPWSDYELIDSGFGEKLERFGQFILIRPEPQALWPRFKSEKEWETIAHGRFVRDNSKKSHRDAQNENGGWNFFKKVPPFWLIEYQPLGLKLKLSCTSFGHLGIFVEQVSNWHFIDEQVKRIGNKPKVLNLFAYTGASSVVAALAGADVTHLDAVRNVVTWANENKQLSKAPEIRWLVEDALKFIRRQAKKGQLYQGIILDPPAYGRGPDGEKWILEDQINELVELSAQILDPTNHFALLNLYSMGLSGTIGVNLFKSHGLDNASWGECLVPSKTGLNLPLCTWVRACK